MTPYITSTDAATYFLTVLNTTAWDNATSTRKDKALLEATRIIDNLNYKGAMAIDTQEHQFPRGTDTVYPQDIKDACCEIALALLDDIDPEIEFQNLRISTTTYADVKVNYDRSTLPANILAGVPTMRAWRLLLPYLRDPRNITLVKV